jgi:hypothetical protein
MARISSVTALGLLAVALPAQWHRTTTAGCSHAGPCAAAN